jgi:6-phosphogluconolactonase
VVIPTMSSRVVHEFANKDGLCEALGEYVERIANSAIAQRNRFVVSVSGGSLPSQLASARLLQAQTDWSRWHVLYSDERFVPLSDADSNHALTQTSFLSHVPIPAANVHTLRYDASAGVDAAARAYEAELESLFGATDEHASHSDGVVEVDLVLLGMGPDGHTASLFPGHALLAERERLIAPIADSPKPPPQRITFTYPLINAARNVAFVVTGAAKQPALREIFESPDCPLPAALVRPATPVVWFVDADAVGWPRATPAAL